MKKIIFYSAFLSIIIISSCKSKDNKISASSVPQSTMAAFNTKYPGATDIAWITEKRKEETIYEAAFNLNGKKIEAEFDANGNFIQED
ncbi:MAG: hypothetical protein ABJA85_01495 [Bacteroidota bacterium]